MNITQIGERLRKIGRILPLLGPLSHCTAKNHWDSIKEFSVTVLFGTATFWVTALFLRGFIANKSVQYFDRLYQTVDSGQLFIFSVGMLGPILLSAADDPKGNRTFPGRLSHLSLLCLIGAIASGFYALQLAGRDKEVKTLLDTDYLFSMSVVIAGVVLVLRYLTMVYRKSTLTFDPETQLKDPVDNFAGSFAARHPGVNP